MSTQLWSYGITTVPQRANDLLPATIESLSAAGFKRPVVFVDGFIEFPKEIVYDLPPMIMRTQAVGHLVNWMSGLLHLYTAYPMATRYAMFEDDLLACPNLRIYLDACLLPEQGYLNLLTHDCNYLLTGEEKGWHKSNQRGKGAVGLVFDRPTVARILSDPGFISRPLHARQCADGMVCEILKPLGYTEYVHYPSLLQHVGTDSTLKHRWGQVRAYREDFDPLHLLEKPNGMPTWAHAT